MIRLLKRLVRSALEEDIGQEDITTNRTIPSNARCEARLIAKQSGVLSGIVLHSDEGMPMQRCPHCGPVVTLSRDMREGDLVYCRVCGREMRAHRQGDVFELEVTGRQGDAEALKPRAELGPIDDLVRQMPKTLRLELLVEELAI